MKMLELSAKDPKCCEITPKAFMRVLFRAHFPRDRFEDAPDVFHQNFMSGSIRMNTIS